MSAIDDIVLSPDDRLKTECAPIEKIDDGVKKLAKRMLKDMYAADGCGLAAPQVGELVQLVVIDVDYAGEGCLSFPGITVEVKRPSHVVVQARNLDGDLMQYEARDNLLAVCLQHEIDHLHGATMVDHLSAGQRIAALRDYEEALSQGARPGDTAAN